MNFKLILYLTVLFIIFQIYECASHRPKFPDENDEDLSPSSPVKGKIAKDDKEPIVVNDDIGPKEKKGKKISGKHDNKDEATFGIVNGGASKGKFCQDDYGCAENLYCHLYKTSEGYCREMCSSNQDCQKNEICNTRLNKCEEKV